MNRSPYVLRCTAEGCHNEARFKVASTWSDGSTQELKTYALACAEHLELLYRRAHERRGRCRLGEGESVSPPAIFRLDPGRRDHQLERLTELEAKFA